MTRRLKWMTYRLKWMTYRRRRFFFDLLNQADKSGGYFRFTKSRRFSKSGGLILNLTPLFGFFL